MLVSAIVACGRNGEIGCRDGDLPWQSIRKDMKWFRKQTMGKTVICGTNTWFSIPESMRPLTGRYNVVLSKNYMTRNHLFPKVPHGPHYAVPDVESALFVEGPTEEVVIIGGAATYLSFWDKITKLYVTCIGDSFPEATVYFPHWPIGEGWTLKEEELHPREKPYPLKFQIFERVPPNPK